MRKKLFACVSTAVLAGLTLGMSAMLFVMESHGPGFPGGSVVLAVCGVGLLWRARRLLDSLAAAVPR